MTSSAIATFALGLATFVGQHACSAELRVLSPPGLMTVLDELEPKFERATRHRLSISFLVPNPMLLRIDADDRFDVVIIETSETGARKSIRLIDRGKVKPSARDHRSSAWPDVNGPATESSLSQASEPVDDTR